VSRSFRLSGSFGKWREDAFTLMNAGGREWSNERWNLRFLPQPLAKKAN
jgi:hypothetical protein